MRVLTVVGARPQFIKAAPVSRALAAAGHQEFLVHTGQHYDYGMSQIFFDELELPQPNVNLGIGSGSHGRQTGEMLIGLEQLILAHQPDWVLVYGDTNSTLAGGLAACKLHIPVAHVEAGLRSFNREMPEEYNRIIVDHCANLLLCPTQTAVDNLGREGITTGVHLVGDTMYDAVLAFAQIASQRSAILERLDLTSKSYVLATVHRPYNTDVDANLQGILAAFHDLGETVIFPVHPRTQQKIGQLPAGYLSEKEGRVRMIDPVGYLDMLVLERNARVILTDSGGIQKEAYYFGVPCVTLRPETEWVETVQTGWNRLVGADRGSIVISTLQAMPLGQRPPIFGDGRSAAHIVAALAANAV